MPLNANGKLDRRALIARLEAGTDERHEPAVG
jgi:hypothetical protein